MTDPLFSSVNSSVPQYALGNLTAVFIQWLQDNLENAAAELNTRPIIFDVQGLSAATPGTLIETTLYSSTIPGGNLQGLGYYTRAKFFGTTSGNANNKTLRVYIGGTKIFDSGVFGVASKDWLIDCSIPLVDTTHENCISRGTINGVGNLVQFISIGLDFSANQVLSFTGQNSVASAADIVLKGVHVEIGKSPNV